MHWQRSCKWSREITLKLMLNWTLTFLVIALIVGLLGFSSLAGATAAVAQVLFVIFVILLVISGFSTALEGKRR